MTDRMTRQTLLDAFPVPLVPAGPVIGSDLPPTHNSETSEKRNTEIFIAGVDLLAKQEAPDTAADIERLADSVTARLGALGFDVSRSGEVIIITRGRRFLMNVSDAIGLADACEQGRLSPNDVPDLILLNHSTRSE